MPVPMVPAADGAAEATPSSSEAFDRLLQSLPAWPVTGEARVDIDGWIRDEFRNLVSAAESIDDVNRLDLAAKKLFRMQSEACVVNSLAVWLMENPNHNPCQVQSQADAAAGSSTDHPAMPVAATNGAGSSTDGPDAAVSAAAAGSADGPDAAASAAAAGSSADGPDAAANAAAAGSADDPDAAEGSAAAAGSSADGPDAAEGNAAAAGSPDGRGSIPRRIRRKSREPREDEDDSE